MAERWRITQPPRGIGNSTLYRYLGDTANALNQLPAFSLASTLTDMNTSGVTADSGTLGFDVGSSATTFYMKESGSSTTGWSSIASHGYVEAYADSVATFVHTPAHGILHSYESKQFLPNADSGNDVKFALYEGTSNISPTGDGYPQTFINSAGTYLCTFSSSFSGSVANDVWEFHFVKNGLKQNLCSYVDALNTTLHYNTPSTSMLTHFNSGDTVAVDVTVSSSAVTYGVHHHQLVIHKLP